jgi:hypothetical protein
MFPRPMLFLALAVLHLVLSGCDAHSGGSPFGTSQPSPLLKPFAGTWECDDERVLEAVKADGATDEELAGYELMRKFNPGGKLHPDMEVNGNTIVYQSIASSEYWLFGLHKHGDYVCGKAWHHEDRHDPGDMSKCYVRLKIKDERLHLDVKMKEGLPGDNDSDLTGNPAIEAGSAESCDAEMPPGSDWEGRWRTWIFKRKT